MPTRPAAAVAVRVVIADGLTRSADQLLDDVLERAGLWALLAADRNRRGRPLTIAIKPDMDFFDPAAPTGTAPALVEGLVQRLLERGYPAVTVVDGCNVDDTWLYNRDALCVPELVGYRFVVPEGPYALVGAGEQVVTGTFQAGQLLQHCGISAAWLNADIRIVFAKNKTDEEYGFALGAYNLLGLLVGARRRIRAEGPAALCVELLRRVPVHFCLIDALVSSHGPAGSRSPCPLATHTLIASPALLLADWVGAAKMGLDPYASPINAEALRRLGLPADFAIDGPLTPYPLWCNPHPAAIASVRVRNRSVLAARLARPLLQPVQRESFPFRELAIDRINAFLTAAPPNGAGARGTPGWWAAPLNYLFGATADALHAFRVLYQKHLLDQVELPLQFDAHAVPAEDYDRVKAFVEGQERLVQGAPADRFGHQWRIVDGAILFRAKHQLETPFDALVAIVEVHRAIQLMNDYLGGSAVVVGRTSDGRVARQAERNVYLPQPNWTALFGAPTIDVEKIETVEYDPDRHQIWWRTVSSPNRSADCDDGSVAFRRGPDGLTEVTIFSRQRFPLPPALAWLHVDRYADLYAALVAAAYQTFVAQTLNNLRQHAGGRPYRIGLPPRASTPLGEPFLQGDAAVAAATTVGVLVEVLSRGPALAEAIQRFFAPAGPAAPSGQLDDDGFRHFPGGPPAPRSGAGAANWVGAALAEAPEFVRGIVAAIHKDIAAVASPDRERRT
jgi:uncharacterized protein (DUF362 family)